MFIYLIEYMSTVCTDQNGTQIQHKSKVLQIQMDKEEGLEKNRVVSSFQMVIDLNVLGFSRFFDQMKQTIRIRVSLTMTRGVKLILVPFWSTIHTVFLPISNTGMPYIAICFFCHIMCLVIGLK